MIKKYIKNFAQLLDQILPNFDENVILNLIEIPPENISGDLGFPCFSLSKVMKKAPNVIALELVQMCMDFQLRENDERGCFSHFEAVGPYVNVHVNSEFLAKDVLEKVFAEQENFGRGEKKDQVVLVESPGPNTNKPLHLGHVRNLLLGNSIESVLKFDGYDVHRVDIVNDRGMHICKSMLAYQLFGNDAEPDKKSDHFVGDWYVKYAQELKKNPELKDDVQTMLLQWEEGNQEVRDLWKKMNTWALDGMKDTYKRYGAKIEKAYFESDYYLKGKEKVLEAFDQGIFVKNKKGNIVFVSKNEHLGEKTVLRSDGTSIYSTNDIGVVQGRYEDYSMNKMVYVVGNEQEDYFKSLFEIFEALDYPFAKDCFHLSYGMIELTTGKMKSREGTVVDADTLADDMHQEAKVLLQERFPDLSDSELSKRAEAIAMSAIKFFILKYDVHKNFVFNPKESLSFEGETGPYLMYTYARMNALLRKNEQNKRQEKKEIYALLVEIEEKNLLLKLAEFKEVISKSAQEYKPNFVVRYALELTKLFNNYYHKHKIIQENKDLEQVRLLLVDAVRIVLGNVFSVLGIVGLDEM